jgi:hypothetical protein
MATKKIPDGCSVPFNADDPRFQHALDKTVRKLEAEIEKMRGPVNKRFLETLASFYADAPER